MAMLYKRLIIKHSNDLTRGARNVALTELLPRTLQALALISSIAKPKPKETRNRHSICICSSRVKIHTVLWRGLWYCQESNACALI